MSISSTTDPNLAAIAEKTKKQLNFSPKSERMEVVYGVGAPSPGQIKMLTRSMLSILGQIATRFKSLMMRFPPVIPANPLMWRAIMGPNPDECTFGAQAA